MSVRFHLNRWMVKLDPLAGNPLEPLSLRDPDLFGIGLPSAFYVETLLFVLWSADAEVR